MQKNHDNLTVNKENRFIRFLFFRRADVNIREFDDLLQPDELQRIIQDCEG